MANHDFDCRDAAGKFLPDASGFRSEVLISKQIIYDLSQSEPGLGDTVKRHERLRDVHDRLDLGIYSALVFLEARFDVFLNRIFHRIWESRRDMLHDWISDQLPRVPNSKRGGEPALLVSLEHIWKVDQRRVSVEDYFEAEIHDLWSAKSPNDKCEALVKILRTDIPKDTLEVFQEALRQRNNFVHPKDTDWPTRGGLPKKGYRRRPEVKREWYDQACEALAWIVEHFQAKTKKATSRNLATNVQDLGSLLSDRQRIVLGTYLMNSSHFGMTFEKLLEVIEKRIKDQDSPPEALVLATKPDLEGKSEAIKAFAKSNPELGIVVFEWHWSDGLSGDSLKKLQELNGLGQITFIPERAYPRGKFDASYDPKKALQDKIKKLTGA